MSAEDTEQFDWYLVGESAKARQFSENEDGSDPFWVPRSLIRYFMSYPVEGTGLRKCLVEVPTWFVEKEGLG